MGTGADPAHRVVVVLIFKGDASGTDTANPIITMAGYVALFPRWVDFEIETLAFHQNLGVSVFHSKEFYDTKGDFRNWSRSKKEGFARDWQKIAVGKLDLGVTFGVVKDKFKEAKREYHVAQQESAFGYCLRSILGYLLSDPVLKIFWDNGETLSIVLESGDSNAADAQRVFNYVKGLNPQFDAILQSFGFAPKASMKAIQFADFLAVSSRKYVQQYSDKEGYAQESGIISALRKGIYLIGEVAEEVRPVGKEQSS